MCRYVVEFAEYSCHHQYPLRRHMVDCNRSWCALSGSHSRVPHDHTRCATQMNPDLNLIMPGNSHPQPCNPCRGLPAIPGNGASATHTDQNGFTSDDSDSDDSGDPESDISGQSGSEDEESDV
ncbi:hypothetical protein OBBRIDRAFT_833366 [Obba rivulosa]|uniref:Uncharacterized protein n=1 Tax=Obba rivulosa TaxID=1052685 RepID=A0A8E2B251_9APHY|nr:hypothetical protein OBBRIDRAFT_833366 [Obba rivulosa]